MGSQDTSISRAVTTLDRSSQGIHVTRLYQAAMRGGFSSDQSSMERDSFDEISSEEILMVSDNINIEDDNSGEEEEPCKSLIVTNVNSEVFVDEMVKSEFEAEFLAFDKTAAFYYIRTFRRVRIDFSSTNQAASARRELDLKVVAHNQIHCYFIKVYGPSQPEEAFLQPPPREKQFLISPPCSPPVGWEQPREGNPVVDYDLLAALAKLGPGEDHEVQPGTSVTPSIVVQVCPSQDSHWGQHTNRPGKIIQTRCPERQHSVED